LSRNRSKHLSRICSHAPRIARCLSSGVSRSVSRSRAPGFRSRSTPTFCDRSTASPILITVVGIGLKLQLVDVTSAVGSKTFGNVLLKEIRDWLMGLQESLGEVLRKISVTIIVK
jgi:hypothetical protein